MTLPFGPPPTTGLNLATINKNIITPSDQLGTSAIKTFNRCTYTEQKKKERKKKAKAYSYHEEVHCTNQ